MPDQSSPQKPEWIPVPSSNLDAVQYDADTRTMRVRFNNGREYTYGQVPADVAQGLVRSDSPGKFFNDFVKAAYPSEESW